MITNNTNKIDSFLYLLGQPPIGEFFSFLKSNAIDSHKLDFGTLADEWRHANDRFKELEKIEAGTADNPTINEIDTSLDSLKNEVMDDSFYKRGYSLIPSRLGMVDLDSVVVFQKNINLTYVEVLKKQLSDLSTDEEIFKFCLPFDHPKPEVKFHQIAPNAYSFYSLSNDFRFLEPTLLNENQISNYSPSGPLFAGVALIVGFGSNFLNVIKIGDRLVLNNGSHRAYALKSVGITKVPTIIQNVSREEEYELLTPQISKNKEILLKNPRPPMLKDYFEEQLIKNITVQKKSRQVKISFGVETNDVPLV